MSSLSLNGIFHPWKINFKFKFEIFISIWQIAISLTIWKEVMFLLPSATKCWMPTVLFIRFTWIPSESDPVVTKSIKLIVI